MFNLGDRVYLDPSFTGTDSSLNPVWGGTQGQIVGIVTEVIGSLGYRVVWENGRQNGYYTRFLRHTSQESVPFIVTKCPHCDATEGLEEINKEDIKYECEKCGTLITKSNQVIKGVV